MKKLAIHSTWIELPPLQIILRSNIRIRTVIAKEKIEYLFHKQNFQI